MKRRQNDSGSGALALAHAAVRRTSRGDHGRLKFGPKSMVWPLSFEFSTFRARVFWSLIPIIFGFFLALGLIGLHQQKQLVEKEFIKRGRGLVSSLARGSQLGIYSENREILKASVQGALADSDVAYVIIYGENGKVLDAEPTKLGTRTWELTVDEKGQLFAEQQTFSRTVKSASGQLLEFFAPVLTRELKISETLRMGFSPGALPTERQAIGAVRVGLSLSAADAHVSALLKWQGALIVAFLILITLAIYAIAQRISRPVRHLTEQSNNIAEGFLDQTIPVDSNDELGRLASSFNHMAQALKDKINEKETVLAKLRELNLTLEERVLQRTAEIDAVNRQLREADRHKSQFLARVNHELRTPISAVIGYARLILRETEGQISPLQRENLRDLQNNAERLLGMINDLLDLATIEAGRMEVRVEPVNIYELINQTLSTVAPMLSHDHVRIVRDVDRDLPSVDTDPEKLRQILVNLLGNAVKFTERGEIKIAAARRDELLELAVSDTGTGIEKEEQAHIFKEFRQAGATASRKHSGSGLGLAIVKKYVNLLGGDVTVESEPGKGSTFTVTLPLDRAEVSESVQTAVGRRVVSI